jgi:hypothetical protein
VNTGFALGGVFVESVGLLGVGLLVTGGSTCGTVLSSFFLVQATTIQYRAAMNK